MSAHGSPDRRNPHAFPTRRSSDLSLSAQKTEKEMKRFYKQVSTSPVAGGFGVLLDGRPVQTPARNALTLPTEKLASAIARSEEHTSELQSLRHLVCRLLLETKTAR